MFEDAWNEVAKGDAQKAERIFLEAEKKVSSLDFEYLLMKGYIKYKLDHWDECISLFESVWIQLEDNDDITIDDRAYLQEYMYSAIEIYQEFFRKKVAYVRPIFPEDIDLSKVNKKWKKRFPCRDHPDWDKYGA